jgi:hypothetical protein
MSNALEKFNPGALAAIIGQEAVAETNDVFAGGISTGEFLPMLSIRGNRFRLRIDGDETVLPETAINVILVTSRANVSKVFYPGQFNPGAEDKKPVCSSSDGMYPDAGVDQPQSETCQLCPNGAWGSKITPSGKKGKACNDYKLVVLALAMKPDTAFALRIPASSLKPFSGYIQKLKLAGVPADAAITKISLGNEEYPTLNFDFVSTVSTREQYEQVKELAQSVEVLNAVKIAPRNSAAPTVNHAAEQPVVAPITEPTPAPPVAEPAPVVEAPVAVEEAAPQSGALADLLGGSKKGKGKKKADEAAPVAAPAATATEVPAEGGEIKGLDQLLAKMKKS